MNITSKLELAQNARSILESTANNIKLWVEAEFLPEWAYNSIKELICDEKWEELNNRFYKSLSFGTGGMRGKTISDIVTQYEQGNSPQEQGPQHPSVGTNILNDFNIIRATIGLFHYCIDFEKTPKLVIAHDVRFFSRYFCCLVASTWCKLGGEAFIFEGPRSTPQLSFSVRYLKATAGINITASHNPPHDNGFKVYFKDGAQVVAPHAEAIIKKVYEVPLKNLPPYFDIDHSQIQTLPPSADDAYIDLLAKNVLNPEIFNDHKPNVVFTPIHGTGNVASIPLMQQFNIPCFTVESQMKADPNFSTVKSPNPENPEALSLAIKLAQDKNADLVIATDPDADRMGVAIPNGKGEMILLNGNTIGSLLAEFRISQLKELNLIPKEGTQSATLIKTFVTTQFQDTIAKAHGLKCINTLTGFKWIGEKLQDYENILKENYEKDTGQSLDYDAVSLDERRKLLLKYSTYFVFGAEESYGYLACESIRDKDANLAVILLCELTAHLKSKGLTILDYLNKLYLKYGYFKEDILNLYYEGASGSEKIKAILQSYRQNPPKNIHGHYVKKIIDFGKDDVFDDDQKRIPNQDFFFIELENNYSYAVRGSGTEPKIKFYLFAQESVPNPNNLEELKSLTKNKLTELKHAIEQDVQSRLQGNSS